MNVSELYQLVVWVSAEVEAKQIPNKYQLLHKLLQQNTQPNQQKQPFDSQVEDLTRTLENVPLSRLTRHQIEFLRQLGIAQALGDAGVRAIEDILYRNALDIATAAEKVRIISQELSGGIQKSNQIKAGLDGYVPEEKYEEKDEVLMRVTFAGDAAMKNVAHLKSWGNAWFDIGRGIAMAHNQSPEDVRVIGATKGSIVIELGVCAVIASTASGIILSALRVAEKVMDIRKKAEELKSLKLKNTKLARDIDKEADYEKKAGIEEITKKFSEKIGLTEGDGDKVNALDKAVKNLVGFVEKGGVVDFILPEHEADETEEEQDRKELRDAFQEIRKLENKLALLEHQYNE